MKLYEKKKRMHPPQWYLPSTFFLIWGWGGGGVHSRNIPSHPLVPKTGHLNHRFKEVIITEGKR